MEVCVATRLNGRTHGEGHENYPFGEAIASRQLLPPWVCTQAPGGRLGVTVGSYCQESDQEQHAEPRKRKKLGPMGTFCLMVTVFDHETSFCFMSAFQTPHKFPF